MLGWEDRDKNKSKMKATATTFYGQRWTQEETKKHAPAFATLCHLAPLFTWILHSSNVCFLLSNTPSKFTLCFWLKVYSNLEPLQASISFINLPSLLQNPPSLSSPGSQFRIQFGPPVCFCNRSGSPQLTCLKAAEGVIMYFHSTWILALK